MLHATPTAAPRCRRALISGSDATTKTRQTVWYQSHYGNSQHAVLIGQCTASLSLPISIYLALKTPIGLLLCRLLLLREAAYAAAASATFSILINEHTQSQSLKDACNSLPPANPCKVNMAAFLPICVCVCVYPVEKKRRNKSKTHNNNQSAAQRNLIRVVRPQLIQEPRLGQVKA